MRQLITIIAVSVFSLYLMNAEAQIVMDEYGQPDGPYGNTPNGPSYEQFDGADNNPPQGVEPQPEDGHQEPQGDPVGDDYNPGAADGTDQSNVLGANYAGSHVQGGTFVQGDSVHNAKTEINNAKLFQGYVGHVPLVASPGTCFGSKGMSVSAPGIGISRNKTRIDKHCNERNNIIMQQNNMRANAEILKQLGLGSSAMTMMCQQDQAVRLALKSSLSEANYIKVCGTANEKEEFQREQEYNQIVAMLPQAQPVQVSAPEKPQPKPKAPSAVFHTVSKGETLWRIAGGTNEGVQRLSKLNPGLTSTIEIGQQIRVQ